MDTRHVDGQTDEKIRDLYRESALRTDMALFTERLRARLAGERRPRAAATPRRGAEQGRPAEWRSRLHARPWRLALVATAGVVVLGAVGFGVYAAVEHFGRETPVLVIGDDSMLGSTAVPSAYDAVLPPGVSAVVGQSGSSLWCLSRELGFSSLQVYASPADVATGTKGDLVAYATGEPDAGNIFLWDVAETGADPGATSLVVGDASQPIVLMSMSPDGTKLAVARTEDTTPDTPSWDGHLYIVDLATGLAVEWQWPEGDAPPAGVLGGFVWSPASDVFYVSFEPLSDSPALGVDGPTYLCDPATGDSVGLGALRSVQGANSKGDAAWLHLDYGPMGALSSAYPKPSITVWQDGKLTSVEPATQSTFGPLSISADGESVVLRGDAYDDSGKPHAVLEVMRHGDAGWATVRVLDPVSPLPVLRSLGFAGGDRYYFAAPRPEGSGSDDPTHWQLGALDPATGEYQMCEELPVESISWVVGVWTQTSTSDEAPDETPDETPENTSTTTPTTEPSSAPAPVTSTASLPLSEVEGTTIFSAGWGSGPGEFGVTRDDSWGLFIAAPGSFWVTPDEKLYILDPLNHRVQVVAADGTVESAIAVDMEYLLDVAAAADGTVLVRSPDRIQAYSAAGQKIGEYATQVGNAQPSVFVADEAAAYCEYRDLVGHDATDAGVFVTKYIAVYRDGEFLDPALGWEAAPYDQPLGLGLGLRSGDATAEGRSEAQPVQDLHVYSGDSLAFSVDLLPSDYGPYVGVATDSGEILVQSGWIVSDDPEGTRLANAVWAFSPVGTPLRRVEVLQPLHSAADSSGGSRARLSPTGALYVLTTTSDRLNIVRYDLGAVGSQLVTIPAQMPADFGLVAKYGPGGFNAIDTIAGTCVKDLVDNGRVGADLSLTGAELQELYRGLAEMDILSYPSYFQPDSGGTAVEGGSDYYLEIRFGGAVVKFLQWQDLYASSQPEAVALREWFATLQGMIEAKPEWKALPPAVGVHDG